MPAIWKGGPGHRAPYRTTHLRVPEPIKDQVQKMIDDYKRQALVGQPATMPQIETSHSPTKNDLEAAIKILLECFPMAPNKGGAIKNQVRKAIAILDPGNPESELRPIIPRRSAKARSAKRPFKPL